MSYIVYWLYLPEYSHLAHRLTSRSHLVFTRVIFLYIFLSIIVDEFVIIIHQPEVNLSSDDHSAPTVGAII